MVLRTIKDAFETREGILSSLSNVGGNAHSKILGEIDLAGGISGSIHTLDGGERLCHFVKEAMICVDLTTC